jgi:ferredoxin
MVKRRHRKDTLIPYIEQTDDRSIISSPRIYPLITRTRFGFLLPLRNPLQSVGRIHSFIRLDLSFLLQVGRILSAKTELTTKMIRLTNFFVVVVVALALLLTVVSTTRAFQPLSVPNSNKAVVLSTPASTSRLFSTTTPPKQEEQETATNKEKPKRKPRYEPKWVKKATLAEQLGDAGGDDDFDKKGIKGSIPVMFKTQNSNVTKTTMALPGQPLRDVATQAGQFIKYGCGRGECGTCECLVAGQWIRPCVATVPLDFMPSTSTMQTHYTITCKGTKNKGISGGKFYSVRSIFVGFWNNLLGTLFCLCCCFLYTMHAVPPPATDKDALFFCFCFANQESRVLSTFIFFL